MGLFRKKETLNEQQLREAGLDRVVFNTPQPAPAGNTPGPIPSLDPPLRARRVVERDWDIVTTVVAPGIEADEVEFTVLPTGDLIVYGEEDHDLSVLADAIETHLSPPYTATAARQEGDIWGVGAKHIEVAEFGYPDADTLELSQRDGVSEFRIDDGPTDVAPPPELQQFGETAGGDFFASAERIDGDYWEVKVNRF